MNCASGTHTSVTQTKKTRETTKKRIDRGFNVPNRELRRYVTTIRTKIKRDDKGVTKRYDEKLITNYNE